MEGKMNAVLMTEPKAGAWEYVEDVDIPQIADDEALIEIKACGICGTMKKHFAFSRFSFLSLIHI